MIGTERWIRPKGHTQTLGCSWRPSWITIRSWSWNFSHSTLPTGSFWASWQKSGMPSPGPSEAPRVDPFRASVLCTRPLKLTVVFVAKSWISIRIPSRSSQPSASSPRMLEGGVKVFSTFRFRYLGEGGL